MDKFFSGCRTDQAFEKEKTITSKPLLASIKVANRVAKYKKPHYLLLLI
jgi:hypothetical protein